ncbi:MAG: PhnD/SsuA/transferrin family substrate-binding protein [Pseudomonadota bacterium]
MNPAQWMRALCAALPLLFVSPLHAELIFSAPPREDAAQAAKDYGPLVVLLSQVLGEKISFQPPASWATYSHAMQAGKYDIVFDGPHFVAWRMEHSGHQPLLRLPGDLGFVAVVRADDAARSLTDLLSHTVCVPASPNLAANVLLAEYGPIAQPRLLHPRNGMAGVYAAFYSGQCNAAVLRDAHYDKKLDAAEREKLQVLFRSRAYPNQALTVGPRISAEQRAAIIAALGKPENHAAIAPLTARFLGNAEAGLIPARAEDYAGLNLLLEKQVWGWERVATSAGAASHR